MHQAVARALNKSIRQCNNFARDIGRMVGPHGARATAQVPGTESDTDRNRFLGDPRDHDRNGDNQSRHANNLDQLERFCTTSLAATEERLRCHVPLSLNQFLIDEERRQPALYSASGLNFEVARTLLRQHIDVHGRDHYIASEYAAPELIQQYYETTLHVRSILSLAALLPRDIRQHITGMVSHLIARDLHRPPVLAFFTEPAELPARDLASLPRSHLFSLDLVLNEYPKSIYERCIVRFESDYLRNAVDPSIEEVECAMRMICEGVVAEDASKAQPPQ